jgi:hypothetical protein
VVIESLKGEGAVKRIYRVIETVVVRRICDVEASSRAEALKKAAASKRFWGTGLGSWLIDAEYEDRHAVLAPLPSVEAALYKEQESLCAAWLARSRAHLEGCSPKKKPGAVEGGMSTRVMA